VTAALKAVVALGMCSPLTNVASVKVAGLALGDDTVAKWPAVKAALRSFDVFLGEAAMPEDNSAKLASGGVATGVEGGPIVTPYKAGVSDGHSPTPRPTEVLNAPVDLTASTDRNASDARSASVMSALLKTASFCTSAHG
jgi:hypothetical protein